MTRTNRVSIVVTAGLTLWMTSHGTALVAQQETLQLPGLYQSPSSQRRS